MKYKPILEMLEKYNEDEKLFKEFFEYPQTTG